MNKTEMVASIAKKTGLTKKDSEKAVDAFIKTIQEGLMDGNKITLAGLGTFEVKEKPERMGVNPRTKEPIKISAYKSPAFKISKTLKAMVAGK